MPKMTITTTTQQAQRIASAFGKRLEVFDETDPKNTVPRDATAAEVKGAIINFIKETVGSIEREAAAKIAEEAVSDIDPT